MGELERALLLDAFDSNWIAPLGPHVDAFESELAARVGVGHAAALSSGTAGLLLGLELLGVGPGDEVLTSTLTFAATASAIVQRGARPVFLDVSPATWTLDPALLAQALDDRARAGRLPRAVLTVDLYGQCCDHDAIAAACARHGVPILEDAAEALGATYRGRAAGALGALGVVSFNGNKIVTTGGGGALLSDRADWIARARYLAAQARQPAPHYEHTEPGYNLRLSNLLAAVGRGQLRALDERVAARRAHNAFYREALGDLPGLTFMPEADYGRATAWLTCVLIDPAAFGADREAVRLALEREDIEARPVWKPMHLQPAFRAHPAVGGRVAEGLFERGLCLPSGSSLSTADRGRVVNVLRAAGRGA